MKFTTVSALLALAPPALADWHFAKNKEIKYTSVEGFFMQDDLATNPTGFDYVRSHLSRMRSHTNEPDPMELWSLEPYLSH